MFGIFRKGYGVVPDNIQTVRYRDPIDAMCGISRDIRGVDNSGVCLSDYDLTQDRAYVLLVGHDIFEHVFFELFIRTSPTGESIEELDRVLTGRNGLVGKNNFEVWPGQVVQRFQSRIILFRYNNHKTIVGKSLYGATVNLV